MRSILLQQSRSPGEPVKPRIKTKNPLNSLVFHNGEMKGISGGQVPTSHDNLFGTFNILLTNGKNLIDEAQQNVKRGLDRISPIDRDIAVHEFLKDFVLICWGCAGFMDAATSNRPRCQEDLNVLTVIAEPVIPGKKDRHFPET